MVTTIARTPTLPALVVGAVHHRRHRPFVHDVDMRSYLWLVDTADLPRHWPLATFRRQDHLGGTGDSLRDEVMTIAGEAGAHVTPDQRVVMLTGARCLGHTFNPLTVYWGLRSSSVDWAVLEIHNTYGGRHHHVLQLDGTGRATVDKAFYVSPFITVDGRYDVRLRLGADRVAVDVNLRQDGRPVLSAGFAGSTRPATAWNRLRAAARTPLVMHQTSLRIRLHGVYLWLRRLPVVPRTARATRSEAA